MTIDVTIIISINYRYVNGHFQLYIVGIVAIGAEGPLLSCLTYSYITSYLFLYLSVFLKFCLRSAVICLACLRCPGTAVPRDWGRHRTERRRWTSGLRHNSRTLLSWSGRKLTIDTQSWNSRMANVYKTNSGICFDLLSSKNFAKNTDPCFKIASTETFVKL